MRTQRLAAAIAAVAMVALPAATPVDDATNVVNDAHQTVITDKNVPSTAQATRKACMKLRYINGSYEALPPEPPPAGSDSCPPPGTVNAQQLALTGLVPNIPSLWACAPDGLQIDASCLQDDVSPYVTCVAELEIKFEYRREGTPPLATEQTNLATMELVCTQPIDLDQHGTVSGGPTATILDRGVPALGGKRQTDCPGGSNAPSKKCEPGDLTTPNDPVTTLASQTIDVVSQEAPGEMHGAGSRYQYQAQFDVTLDQIGVTLSGCADADFVDPRPMGTIDVAWLSGACPPLDRADLVADLKSSVEELLP